MAVYRLQVNEPGATPRVLVVGEPTEIGRDCDGIVVDDPTASRRHVEVHPTDDGLILRDLGSSNGTIAGGEPVDEPLVLAPGAWFELGETRIVVHEAREGDEHATVADVATPRSGEPPSGRASGGRRALGQAGRTDRPGGPVRRPPRS